MDADCTFALVPMKRFLAAKSSNCWQPMVVRLREIGFQPEELYARSTLNGLGYRKPVWCRAGKGSFWARHDPHWLAQEYRKRKRQRAKEIRTDLVENHEQAVAFTTTCRAIEKIFRRKGVAI